VSKIFSFVYFFVVCFIVFFGGWYNAFFRGFLQFFGLFFVFIFSMFFMVDIFNYYFLIVRWEIMGVISYFLIILFFGRDLAQNRALLAILLNRVRDFLLFCFVIIEWSFLRFFAITAKSSIAVFCSWLPNAIEGPTPVSSLLHSSTMVVARVFIFSFLGIYCRFFGFLLVFYGTYMGLLRRFFKDYKRVVAYSTSSQLCLLGLFFVLGSFSWCLFYIAIHAFFKASLFILTGMIIHLVESQTSRFFNNTAFWRSFVFCLMVIVRTPFLGVSSIKDDFLLCNSFTLFWARLVFAVSTLFYSLKLTLICGHRFLHLFFRGILFFFGFGLFFLSFLDIFFVFFRFFGDFLGVFFVFWRGFLFKVYRFLGWSVYDIFYKGGCIGSLSLGESEMKIFFGFLGFLGFLL